ncbi:MAG: hypothetical protein GF401_12225 [Chitinivibrionales bacterium]|nr:hypothetical protein [Chitinivibrionales bacterium]
MIQKLILLTFLLHIGGCLSGSRMVRHSYSDDMSPYVFDYLGTKPVALKDIDTLLKQLGFTIDTIDTVRFMLTTKPKVLEYDEREEARFIIESGIYSTEIPQDKGVLTFTVSHSEVDSAMVKVEMTSRIRPEKADSATANILPKSHPFPAKIARILRRTGRFEPRERLIAP